MTGAIVPEVDFNLAESGVTLEVATEWLDHVGFRDFSPEIKRRFEMVFAEYNATREGGPELLSIYCPKESSIGRGEAIAGVSDVDLPTYYFNGSPVEETRSILADLSSGFVYHDGMVLREMVFSKTGSREGFFSLDDLQANNEIAASGFLNGVLLAGQDLTHIINATSEMEDAAARVMQRVEAGANIQIGSLNKDPRQAEKKLRRRQFIDFANTLPENYQMVLALLHLDYINGARSYSRLSDDTREALSGLYGDYIYGDDLAVKVLNQITNGSEEDLGVIARIAKEGGVGDFHLVRASWLPSANF